MSVSESDGPTEPAELSKLKAFGTTARAAALPAPPARPQVVREPATTSVSAPCTMPWWGSRPTPNGPPFIRWRRRSPRPRQHRRRRPFLRIC